MMNFLKIMALTVTMPNLQAIDFTDILKKIGAGIAILIFAVALITGLYEFFLGLNDGNSAGKQKGLQIILGGVIIAGLLYTLLSGVFGIVW